MKDWNSGSGARVLVCKNRGLPTSGACGQSSPVSSPQSLVPILLFALLLTGCVSQYKVVVDFSPDLKAHFTEFPTIEVDIAAVNDGEADEVKQMGVERYFAPDSGIRERLQSQTCFFYKEEQHTFVLPSRAPIWWTWKLKEPTNVLVIASLPPNSAISPQADPRYLTVKMAKSFVLARTIYIMVEPEKIIQVDRASSGKDGKSSPAGGKWIEIK